LALAQIAAAVQPTVSGYGGGVSDCSSSPFGTSPVVFGGACSFPVFDYSGFAGYSMEVNYVGTSIHFQFWIVSDCSGVADFHGETETGMSCGVVYDVNNVVVGSFSFTNAPPPPPSFNGTLGLTVSRSIVKVGGTVTLTADTTPPTSGISIVFTDHATGTQLTTATTNAAGIASSDYSSASPAHWGVQAVVGTIVSVIRPLTVRDTNAVNAYNQYGQITCTGRLEMTTQVLDEHRNPGAGSVSSLGNSDVIGTQLLNAVGQTSVLDITAHASNEISAYYVGTAAWSNENTWFICS